MDSTLRLPVELWEDILSDVLLHGFLPPRNSSLFENINVFSHPCKVYWHMVTVKTTLRLVCRTWNQLLRRPHLQVSFIDASPPINRISDRGESVHRVEVIYSPSAYCLQWPCLRRSVGVGDSFHRQPLPLAELEEAEMPVFTTGLRVLRLPDDYQDSTRLLQSNTKLEALWIPYAAFRTAYEPRWTTCLSHLHLDSIFDDGNVYRLVMPQLEYVRLHMSLYRLNQTQLVFPLDISMPRVTTVYIDGSIHNKYLEGMNKMIFDAKDTIVNLLLSDSDKFSWERLDEFPQLQAFGFDIHDLCSPLPEPFALYPISSSSSMSFIMTGMEWHNLLGPYSHCDQGRVHLVDIMSRSGKWVGKVVVPFVWREMELMCVNVYEKKRRADKPDEVEYPCCWPCIEYIDRHNIRIEDQNCLWLRKGDGLGFSDRMRTLMPNSRDES